MLAAGRRTDRELGPISKYQHALAFIWWTTRGPDAAVQSAVAGIIGVVPFVISWVLAAKFHADSLNLRAGVHGESTRKGA